jgi:hypothetical protein
MIGIWFIAIFASLKSRPLLLSLLWSSFFWALLLISWSLRNRIETGSFSLDSHGGINLVYGTLLFNVNEQDTSAAIAALEKMPAFAEVKDLPASKQDRIYWKAAFQFMREHPAQVMRQWERKTVNFWRFYPRSDKFYMEGPRSRPDVGFKRTGLVFISLLTEPGLILLGAWGLIELFNVNRDVYPIILFVLATFLLHVVSVSQMRYRLPVMPFLILGFSYFFASLMPII